MSAPRRTTVTALAATGVIAGMLGLTAAAVPLYDLFCRVTGYGGTTQRAEQAPEVALDQTIKIRFNADVARGMPWAFAPAAHEVEVQIGEQSLAFYRARNDGDHPIIGTATFNVTPAKAGVYFSKIDCFCFTEQVLEPGESVDMPVSFFIDPAIVEDPGAKDLRSITLSYTFFPRDEPEDADGRPSS